MPNAARWIRFVRVSATKAPRCVVVARAERDVVPTHERAEDPMHPKVSFAGFAPVALVACGGGSKPEPQTPDTAQAEMSSPNQPTRPMTAQPGYAPSGTPNATTETPGRSTDTSASTGSWRSTGTPSTSSVATTPIVGEPPPQPLTDEQIAA